MLYVIWMVLKLMPGYYWQQIVWVLLRSLPWTRLWMLKKIRILDERRQQQELPSLSGKEQLN